MGVLALSEHLVDGCFFPDFKIKFIIDLRLSAVGLGCLVVSMYDEILLWVMLGHACGRADGRSARAHCLAPLRHATRASDQTVEVQVIDASIALVDCHAFQFLWWLHVLAQKQWRTLDHGLLLLVVVGRRACGGRRSSGAHLELLGRCLHLNDG